MEAFFIFLKITHFRESSSSTFVKKTDRKKINYSKHTDKAALKVFSIIKNIAICTEQRMRFFQKYTENLKL